MLYSLIIYIYSMLSARLYIPHHREPQRVSASQEKLMNISNKASNTCILWQMEVRHLSLSKEFLYTL